MLDESFLHTENPKNITSRADHSLPSAFHLQITRCTQSLIHITEEFLMTFPGIRRAGNNVSALTCAIVLVLVLGVTPTSPVFGQAKSEDSLVEQALIKLENDWNDATVKKDVVVLGNVLADEYIFTDPEGVMFTKAQELAMLKSGEDVVTSAVSTDMKVRVYGNAAVVTGHYAAKEQLKGKDISATYAFTDTWVKRPGAWVCVATHASRLAQK
jgi:ketosteroid isomerase-like protein